MKNAVQQQRRRQQATKPISSMEEKESIYELWRQLVKIYDKPFCDEEIAALRAEMLKRCNMIDCVNGETLLFGIMELQNLNATKVSNAISLETNGETRFFLDRANTKDMGAALLFLAWEMEQREKEETK